MAARLYNFVGSNVKTSCHLTSIVQSKYFTLFMLTIVVSNTIVMIFETYDDYYDEYYKYFLIAERIYLCIYIIECCLKLWVYSWRFFTFLWNCFDLFIIVISLIELISHELTHDKTQSSLQVEENHQQSQNRFGRINHFLRVLRVLRVLRSFRALRVLRTIRFIQPLHTIVKTCSKALPAMATITFIMIILTCIAAIIARNLFGDICPESFDNLVRTVFSLFVLLTLDDWYSIYQRCEGRDYTNWQLIFCLIYIFIMNFILLNLLMAVLVDSFQQTLDYDKNNDIDQSNDEENIDKRISNNLNQLMKEFCQEKKRRLDDQHPSTSTKTKKKNLMKYFRLMENLEFRIERHEDLTKLAQKSLKILLAEQDIRKNVAKK